MGVNISMSDQVKARYEEEKEMFLKQHKVGPSWKYELKVKMNGKEVIPNILAINTLVVPFRPWYTFRPLIYLFDIAMLGWV